MKKFRRQLNPGEKCVNHAQFEETRSGVKDNYVYGQKSVKGHTAASCMQNKKVGYEGWMQEQKEKNYASSKTEPLGRRREYNYDYPPEIKENPEFKFGIQQTTDEKDVVKKTIFPRGVADEQENDRQQYILSHSAWRPEEQVNRHYCWPEGKVDPKTHSFGRPYTPNKDSVSRCLDAVTVETNKGGFSKTEIGSKVNEDYRRITHNDVGRVKTRGQGAPPVPEGFAFGYRPAGDRFSTKEIISGAYTLEETAPDLDLNVNSKLVKNPRKLSAPMSVITGELPDGKFIDSRRLGVPSVRHDIPAPKRKSVSDTQNYGGEPGAHHLLRPRRFAQLGVTDEEFVIKRSKSEIRDLINSVLHKSTSTLSSEQPGASTTGGSSGSLNLLPCDFEEAYGLAVKVQQFIDHQNGEDDEEEFHAENSVSLRAFLHATGHKVDERVAVEMGALSVVLGLPPGEGAEYPQYEMQNYKHSHFLN
eukprot:GDKJ01054520.1.p1 GENE.GDKJ01054520.1~~GDKJ01054520.1.p1  ORF type:complete len:537 (+),score=104.89 GDKJ01054520.1:195-1613(+)